MWTKLENGLPNDKDPNYITVEKMDGNRMVIEGYYCATYKEWHQGDYGSYSDDVYILDYYKKIIAWMPVPKYPSPCVE